MTTQTAAEIAALPATAAAARAAGIKIQSTRRPASEGRWVRGEIVPAGGKRFVVIECEYLPRDEDNQRFRAEFRALMIEAK